MDWVDIILRAIPWLPAWLQSQADIVIKATPLYGSIIPLGILLSSFIVFMMMEEYER